jgi:hypothetical protein
MTMRSLRWLLALAALVLAAFATNPTAERHRVKVKEAFAERSRLAAVLHLGDLTAFVSTYHSLGVASYTTVNDRVLSVGALGMVFVLEPGERGHG